MLFKDIALKTLEESSEELSHFTKRSYYYCLQKLFLRPYLSLNKAARAASRPFVIRLKVLKLKRRQRILCE